ncbi:hypothetical protein GJ496_005955 [Pomphorhynchus laevis]|nr:hypothetical protein GJ496_005955 [Pomphorhynchus laevis]
MKSDEFKLLATSVIEKIISYRSNLRSVKYVSEAEVKNYSPGFILSKFPNEIPQDGNCSALLIEQLLECISPGFVHWQHPRFHGYFPLGGSYASILGELISNGLAMLGFTWQTCPSCIELEFVVLKWLTNCFKLPDSLNIFKNTNALALMLGSASEGTLISLCAARDICLRSLNTQDTNKLIGYASTLAHPSIQKAAKIANVRITYIEPEFNDDMLGANRFSLCAMKVYSAMQTDRARGLLPFFLLITWGSTDLCSFDKLQQFTEISRDIWIHIDAAYSGVAMCCPEVREEYFQGIEISNSICINPYKWMLVNRDGCCFWCNRKKDIEYSMNADAPYFCNTALIKDDTLPSYFDSKKFTISTGKDFRAIKYWLTMSVFGLEGIRTHIRNHIKLAKYCSSLIERHPLVRLVCRPHMGLICFRVIKQLMSVCTLELLNRINKSGELYLTGTCVNNENIIRICMCAQELTREDIDKSWSIIQVHLNNYCKYSFR